MKQRFSKKLSQAVSAVVGIAIVLAVVGGIAGVKILQFDAMATAASQQVMPPEPVNVFEVRPESWQPRLAAVGSIMPVQGTVVSTEAEGVVREVRFEPGSTVAAGAVLARLDDDVEQSELRAAEAAAELAVLSYERARGLVENRTISREEFDAAEANLKQSRARVDNIRALIAKKVVRAPFAGKLGIRRISIGQYLQKGSPVVELHSLDPVYVDFSLPQQRLGDLAGGLDVIVASDAWPGEDFGGTISAVEPNVDPATRNVRVQATLANPDGRLRPGMFVSVEVVLDRTDDVLVIPATAVQHAPFGDSVFVVEQQESGDALVLRQQQVRLGARRGDFVVATEGVSRGDAVVSTGAFKLRPGMPVVIDNTLAPDFRLAPAPDNT